MTYEVELGDRKIPNKKLAYERECKESFTDNLGIYHEILSKGDYIYIVQLFNHAIHGKCSYISINKRDCKRLIELLQNLL